MPPETEHHVRFQIVQYLFRFFWNGRNREMGVDTAQSRWWIAQNPKKGVSRVTGAQRLLGLILGPQGHHR